MQAVGAKREGLFPFKQHIISSCVFVFQFRSVSPAITSAKALVQTHSCFGRDRNGFHAAQIFIPKSFGNFEDGKSPNPAEGLAAR